MIEKLNILNKEGAKSYILNPKIVGYVTCLNLSNLSHALKNKDYMNVLIGSKGVIMDGFWASKLIGYFLNIKTEHYPGPNFFLDSLKLSTRKNMFLGSTTERLNSLEKNLMLKGYLNSKAHKTPLPFKEVNEFNYEDIASKVLESEAELIWVSLGAPKQEFFARRLWSKLKDKTPNKIIIICVGAAFDFYNPNNKIPRAPIFFQNFGIEWLWRLFFQPIKSIKRLFEILQTMPLLIKILQKRNS